MPREKIKKINRKIKAPRNFGSKAKKITKIWQQKYFPLSKSKLKSRNLRAALVGYKGWARVYGKASRGGPSPPLTRMGHWAPHPNPSPGFQDCYFSGGWVGVHVPA